jgi:hypothetical protein
MIDPHCIVMSYESFGGTGPKAVAAASGRLQERLDTQKAALDADLLKVNGAYQRCLRIAQKAAAEPQHTAAGLLTLIEQA